jgi:hypothetical protein
VLCLIIVLFAFLIAWWWLCTKPTHVASRKTDEFSCGWQFALPLSMYWSHVQISKCPGLHWGSNRSRSHEVGPSASFYLENVCLSLCVVLHNWRYNKLISRNPTWSFFFVIRNASRVGVSRYIVRVASLLVYTSHVMSLYRLLSARQHTLSALVIFV